MEEKEVTPEELLEAFKETGGDPGSLATYFLMYLEPHMTKAILATNADAITKAEAINRFGHLIGSYRALFLIYRFAWRYSQESFFKEELKDIALTAQDVAKKLIELYSDIKKGKPLNIITYEFTELIVKLEFRIDDFLAHLAQHIDKLRPS